MTVERLIKQLEKYNPKAEVRLNDSRGTTALFALSMKDKEDFVWIEGKADIDLGDEIAARFEKGINYDILKELEDIRIRMYNTNFDQDRIILSDAIELIKDREKYRTGMKVIYEGTDENGDILCPNCRTSVARMDDYEEMRPAHCPECGTKLIYGAENPTEKTDMEYLQELDSSIIKAELLSFLDDAVYDQNRPFKEQFVEFIKNDEI